jgi:hypothetical protein
MATPLQSSGQISLSDIRNYLGQPGQISLSGTTFPYSVNQVFNSSTGTVVPFTNTLSLSNMYSKTFAMYSTFSRNIAYTGSYADFFTGTFKAYLGFGTTGDGRSGMLYDVNQGFPIIFEFNVPNTQTWENIAIRGRFQGVWSNIGPPFGYSQLSWITTQEVEEIIIEVLFFGASVVMDMIAAPSADGITPGEGAHIMQLIRLELEDPDPSSSSGLIPPR